jgi:four helix bundle protein
VAGAVAGAVAGGRWQVAGGRWQVAGAAAGAVAVAGVSSGLMDEGFRSLKVYRMAFALSMEIFEMTKGFPQQERYALTDQIRRASRSVCANIAEAYRKRQYPSHFSSKASDADAEAAETSVWIDFAKACQYITESTYQKWIKKYDEVGRMLGGMVNHPEKFLPKP